MKSNFFRITLLFVLLSAQAAWAGHGGGDGGTLDDSPISCYSLEEINQHNARMGLYYAYQKCLYESNSNCTPLPGGFKYCRMTPNCQALKSKWERAQAKYQDDNEHSDSDVTSMPKSADASTSVEKPGAAPVTSSTPINSTLNAQDIDSAAAEEACERGLMHNYY